MGALLIGGLLLCACVSTRQKVREIPSSKEQSLEVRTDTPKTFVPLHPPVVVPKSWREVVNEQKEADSEPEKRGE